MVFSSLKFIFIFLPAFLTVYALSKPQQRNAVLFLGSIIFYALGVQDKYYVMLFLITVIFNFIIGEFIAEFRRASKLWLTVGIIFNFMWLLFFKYSGFILTNVNSAFGADLPVRKIILPIGISFYTFQNVSYIADVYRKKAQPEKSLMNYGAYIAMFPQLIAGPIVTYKTVSMQLRKRTHSAKNVDDGLKTFTIGLGMKVLVANQIGGLWKDIAAIGYESISCRLAWLGAAAYSFQLYFDFCGYSLMAIGLGKILGFDIPKNFDYPYLSCTMTDFWRRWHITLGTWFRDYIYIPLGGNRTTRAKTIRNYLVVWLFTGIWHGADWNFVIWGLVLFFLIVSEKFVYGKFLEKFRLFGHIYMLFVIPVTWLVFAITDLGQLKIYFSSLLPFVKRTSPALMETDYLKYWGIYSKYFIAAILLSTRIPEMIYKKIKHSLFGSFVLLAVFWASVYCMYKGMDDPFMYFRF